MNTKCYFIIIVAAFAMLCSCQNKDKSGGEQHKGESIEATEPVDPVGPENTAFDNPLDSILHSVNNNSEFYDEVIRFLSEHPDFANQSKDVGYYTFGAYDGGHHTLWKDCGAFRVYSIPYSFHWAQTCRNVIQYKGDNGRYDTLLLQDNDECMEELCEVKNENGKTYYLLKTSLYCEHRGVFLWESISAFSFDKDKGCLVKEKLFRTKKKQYDRIKVGCGGHFECPLKFDELVLIGLFHFDDNEEAPTVVITNVNENYWPTGYGLKYQWNGDYFEYAGQCSYEANGYEYVYD